MTTTNYRYFYEGERVIGMSVNGTAHFWFQSGVSGNIERMVDSAGNLIARYVYDAWGNHILLIQIKLILVKREDVH